jgi:hypothetical protein
MSLFSEAQQQQRMAEVKNDNETTESYNREEEYQRAQQAAVEAVMVGRETLEATIRQGEQLRNAENMADDTEYTLDKANRMLRGMTWSGFILNKFSRDVDPPEYKDDTINNKSVLGPPKVYEQVPDLYKAAAQSLQNYHANLQVLEDCETNEQKETCRLICDDMHRQVNKKITDASTIISQQQNNENNNDNNNACKDTTHDEYFALQLQEDVSALRQRQLVLQHVQRGLVMTTGEKTDTSAPSVNDKVKLFNNVKHNDTTTDNGNDNNITSNDIVTIQQDQHLDIINQQLQELGSLAGNLNISLHQQSEVIDSLDNKNDTLHFKTKTVNRRTERFIQDKSWTKPKAEFVRYAWIRHQISGRYLSVASNNDSTTLVLSNVLNERCIFGIWKRNRVLGLQNKYNRRWAGQSLLGQLTCSASTFNRREEWETDNDWSGTTLLIVSAGWGSGGYLLLDKEGKGVQPLIGGGDISIKKQAPKWCINEFIEK